MKISNDFKFILTSFLSWRILLYAFALIAVFVVPLQTNFLGGGLKYYLSSPLVWLWANFDGEHYLAIAQHGYGSGEQAFFPLYPWLINFISTFLGKDLLTLNLIGQVISNFSFFLALVGLLKLVRIDYSEKVARLTILILLLFPTSYYLASVYTESFFLATVIWSFYFARKGNWLIAGVLGSLASATRVIGVLLLPVLLIEWYIQGKKGFKELLCLLLIPIGFLTYMFYLRETTGDWLAFLHALSYFGEQRSSALVILPQVFYRYFGKILPNLDYSYFPVLFTTFLETTAGIVFFGVSVYGLFKLRFSYAIYLFLGYLIPSLSGSFSSLPRYVLVLFPAFILLSLWLSKKNKIFVFSICAILLIALSIALSLFSRAYWVS